MESDVHGGETQAECATRLLMENAPRAALAVIHLAQHSSNEQTRLRAASMIIDRVLGRIADSNPLGNEDPFSKIAKVLSAPITTAPSSQEGH
jgi:hypothetical protein